MNQIIIICLIVIMKLELKILKSNDQFSQLQLQLTTISIKYQQKLKQLAYN